MWRVSRGPSKEVLHSRPGLLGGKDHRSENAHTVRNGFNYNGSGEDAFGGAKSWPVVTATVSFPTGRDDLAKRLTGDLKTFVDEFLTRNGL